MDTNLFKFMALRAPDTTAMEERADELLRDGRPFDSTPAGRLLEEKTPPASEESILRDVRAAIVQMGFSPESREPVLHKLGDFLASQRESFHEERFAAELKDVLGASPDEFYLGKEFPYLLPRCWDRLFAFYLLKRVEPVNLEALMRDLRGLDLVRALASGDVVPSAELLDSYAARPVVIPQRLATFTPYIGAKRERGTPPEKLLQGYNSLWRDFGDLYQARKEVRSIKWEQKSVQVPAKSVVVKDSQGKETGKVSTAAESYQLGASAKELARLSEGSRAWLTGSRAPDRGVTLAVLTDALNEQLTSLQSRILAIKDPVFFELLPRSEEWSGFFNSRADLILYPGLIFLFDPATPAAPSDPFSRPLPAVRPLGVGDLKVVKESFQEYKAGEIAHVENVLQGEYKERKHRQLDRNEDITTIGHESTEESERDTQKTDRFELKKETEKAIESEMSVETGMTVSASYGPVSIGARAEFAYSTSSSETNRSSSNFAQEIVSRAVDKIQKKTREERVRRVLQETEETNFHGVDNKAGTGHVTGIYRFIDKHYKARIHNYGRRLMFEFIVPEPAAFVRHSKGAAAAAPLGDIPPLIPLGTVTHRDIQDWNYHEYIQRYSVQGVTPPPPAYTTVAISLASGDMTAGVARGDSNKELNIPAGYVAKYWTGRTQYSTWSGGEQDLTLIVGNGNGDGSLNDEDTNVPVALHMLNVAAYAATVEVHCERTPRHFEDWQINTYEKIVAAYRAKVSEKDNQASATRPLGISVTGQNPRLNRIVEKAELKKNCITIMTNQHFGSFNAMSGVPPRIDVPESFEEGKYIQFFEQAFEWEQLTYLFYPYFWGRRDQWPAMMAGADPDPLFDQFLKAGAARVLIPVHPLYNDAVFYYLKTGRVWNGGEAPRIDDPLFMALYEELRDQQDNLDGAIPDGEPWDVVVPTSLVYLQQDFSLQTTNGELNPSES